MSRQEPYTQAEWEQIVDDLIEMLHRLQTYNHPFYAPFVAVTCHGLKRLKKRH